MSENYFDLPGLSNSGMLERFMRLVSPEPNSGCWLWSGSVNEDGYGTFSTPNNSVGAHRLAYRMFRGATPIGLELDHLCRVRCCVNPYHMEAVTHQENCRRGLAGATQLAKTHCPQGHEYTESNTIRWRTKRSCKECHRAMVKRQRSQP